SSSVPLISLCRMTTGAPGWRRRGSACMDEGDPEPRRGVAGTLATGAALMSRDQISDRLAAFLSVADREVAAALWVMDYLKRPLLLEGQAGVGKTEVAKALAALHETELIRLQCYEGLDQNAALYEWNYQRQLLAIKAREGAGEGADAIEEHIFSEKY